MGIEVSVNEYSRLKVYLSVGKSNYFVSKMLRELGIPYFNVNEDGTSREERIKEKELCSYHLFVITEEDNDLSDIATIVDMAHRNPYGTMFVNLCPASFSSKYIQLREVGEVVEAAGARYYTSIDEVNKFLTEEWETLKM